MDDDNSTPSHLLSVEEYVNAHAKELVSMSNVAEKIIGNNQPLQKLPRHMRRRAASHNIKRLPRKMHNWAKKEMSKAGPPSKNRRPSRKYRRRPANLLKEYARRQRRFVWLETHIWHAKRFHMAEKWGYKIPLHPNDKGARAAYRASAKYCLLQDFSYYCCVELRGEQKKILEALGRLYSSDTGLTFAAKVYLSGKREGRTVLYRHDRYPFCALGEVKFLWRACEDDISDSSKVRQLWIWSHPAMYQDLMTELRIVIGVSDKMDPMETSLSEGTNIDREREKTDPVRDSEDNSEAKTEAAPNIQPERFHANDLTVESLKDTLCRFHLTGPLSSKVLAETLKVTTSYKHTAQGIENLFLNEDTHQLQAEFWDKMKVRESPGELEPNSVIGLTVWDPRLFLPNKKSMVVYENMNSGSKNPVGVVPLEVSQSRIWEKDVREKMKATKLSDHSISKRRSEALVPGTDLAPGTSDSRIPLLLIQQPGRRPSLHDNQMAASIGSIQAPGYGSGWDVVVPGGWAMAFFVGFVYRGARAVGLRENLALSVEEGVWTYPSNYPDTAAGRDWEVDIWREKRKKYDRIPPAKKTNFLKLGVTTPYYFPWTRLLADWCPGDGGSDLQDKDYFVLRSRSKLRALQRLCSGNDSGGLQQKRMRLSPENCLNELDALVSSVTESNHCLVPVQVTIPCRGKPVMFSMICLPNAEDLAELAKNPKYGGPKEPIHKTKEKPECLKTSGYVKPPEAQSVAKSCTRRIIGFVKEGNFSFAVGQGFGLGYVALRTFKCLLQDSLQTSAKNKCVVLLRSTTSLQYRFAYLCISVS